MYKPDIKYLRILFLNLMDGTATDIGHELKNLYAECKNLMDWTCSEIQKLEPEDREFSLLSRVLENAEYLVTDNGPDPEKWNRDVILRAPETLQKIIDWLWKYEVSPLIVIGRRKQIAMNNLNASRIQETAKRIKYLQDFIDFQHAKHPNLDSGALRAAAVCEAMKFPLSRKQAKRYADLLTIPK